MIRRPGSLVDAPAPALSVHLKLHLRPSAKRGGVEPRVGVDRHGAVAAVELDDQAQHTLLTGKPALPTHGFVG